MIIRSRNLPLGTIITRMTDGKIEFTISTAKEGVFKGLTTYVWLPSTPTRNLAAKIFYMPSMNKHAIHVLHNGFVAFIDEFLNRQCSLHLVIDIGLKKLKDEGYALEIVTSDWFKSIVYSLINDMANRKVCFGHFYAYRYIGDECNKCNSKEACQKKC